MSTRHYHHHPSGIHVRGLGNLQGCREHAVPLDRLARIRVQHNAVLLLSRAGASLHAHIRAALRVKIADLMSREIKNGALPKDAEERLLFFAGKGSTNRDPHLENWFMFGRCPSEELVEATRALPEG